MKLQDAVQEATLRMSFGTKVLIYQGELTPKTRGIIPTKYKRRGEDETVAMLVGFADGTVSQYTFYPFELSDFHATNWEIESL